MKVTIERLVHLGMGLGRVDGRVWLVPLTAPGDVVEATPERERPGLVEARLVSVLEPGPDRVSPPCPIYGRCGGCHLQHIAPDRQPTLKAALLQEVLRRIAKIDSPTPEIVSGNPWSYRCRIELHGGPAGAGARLGFFARHSHDLVEPDACPIAMTPVSDAIPRLRDALARLHPRGPVTLEPVAGADGGIVVVARGDLGDPAAAARLLAATPGVAGSLASSKGHGGAHWAAAGATQIAFPTDDGAGGRTALTLDPRGFTQANLALNPALAATVRDLAGIVPGTRVLELFAGAGNLTVPMALAGARVTAVELNREALERAGVEVKARGLEVRLRAARVEDVAGAPDLVTPPPDVVVADPPRTGMGAPAARALASLPVARVVLCACDPATLARDLGPFLAAGFRLDRLVLVDMFPQTFHLETVARLVRT